MKKIDRKVHTLDATGKAPGRLASQIAILLRGKNKPEYEPYLDLGDVVYVENVKKLKFTGQKLEQKKYHRFTVSGRLVHNCGYGGSVGALKAMGALESGMTEEELKPLVDAWRQSNPNIVSFWWDVDEAVKQAVRNKTATSTHGIRFSYESGFLFIALPSGRRLAYVKPRIGTNMFGSDCVTYEGVGATKKWERIDTFGGKLVENCIQAISRDLLCHAMQQLEAAGCRIVMHIHDEVVIEAPKGMQ
ncbi:MAG: hypothetical protein EOM23_10000, partial [Candidatus Moranbacteria bacterium]|nr:hypothetical protein [Candidatus Moranbacteria bacterium]